MATNGVGGTGGSTGTTTGSAQGKSKSALGDVDLDQFLKLMITELQNQDPLNPVDNSQFLQQITQIREITATDHLTTTLDSVLQGTNLTTASGLIGKSVKALTDDASDVSGVVDRVSVAEDEKTKIRSIRVHIGENAIKLENIREVKKTA